MNLILILLYVTGCFFLGAALLKILETGPSIGPAFTQATRVVILSIIFLTLLAALEALATKAPMRKGDVALMLILGAFSLYRANAATWVKIFERPGWWQHRADPAPK